MIVWVSYRAVMDDVLGQVRARESAARARVEGLHAELERITVELTAGEEALAGWEITRDNLMLLRAEQNGAGPAPVIVPESEAGVLGGTDRAVVDALTVAGAGMRAKEICEVIGLEPDHRHVETLRARLKRLVKQGVLVEDSGLFTLAEGVRTQGGS